MMNIEEHYRELFSKYGDSYKAAQWSDRITQEKRFEVLCQIGDLKEKKILDFGCGTGDLATYLKKNNVNVNYYGVDIVDELLNCAKEKHPDFKFGKLEEFYGVKFDYILISGVFNNKMVDNVTFYQNTLELLKDFCISGIAFNMLSKYVDFYNDELYYEYPENVFKYSKENITPYVVIRNEYQLKENIIPFEFTTYLYMKE